MLFAKYLGYFLGLFLVPARARPLVGRPGRLRGRRSGRANPQARSFGRDFWRWCSPAWSSS